MDHAASLGESHSWYKLELWLTVLVDDRLTPGDDWPHEMQATVRANFPMTPIKELGNVYYFEVTIEKNEKPKYVPESDRSS